MTRKKLSANQARSITGAQARGGSRLGQHKKNITPVKGAQRREVSRTKEMESKIEAFFTAPRNFDFSVDTKEKKRRDNGEKKTIKSWHSWLSEPYAQARGVLLGKKYRTYTITFTSILVILVLIWLSATLDRGQKLTPVNSGLGGTTQAQQIIVDPDFDVVEPDGGPETPTQFDPSTGVASFADRLNDGSIVVSQQVIPEEQRDESNFLLSVSQSFNANKSFSSDNGEVYIGTNEDNGVQFVAFVVEDKLVLIQSEFTQTDAEWKNYINSF